MTRQFTRILFSALCLVSLLIQSLGGGIGMGGVICIGCDRGGWAISFSADHGNVTDSCGNTCCDKDEADRSTTQTAVHGEERCGCVDVPLGSGVPIVSTELRVNSSHAVIGVFVAGVIPSATALLECQTEIWCRAGPKHPPRLLSPSSRRTVLVI